MKIFVLEDIRHGVGPKVAGLGNTDDCGRRELNLRVKVQFGIYGISSLVYILPSKASHGRAFQMWEG